MKITLKRSLDVTRAVVFAELAFLESRPELGYLCRHLISDAAGTAVRMSAGIVQAALPGLSGAGAEQIVAVGRDLGLWDRAGCLTELGQACALDDHAPVPEQGTYEMWLVDDPLLGGCRPLHCERLSLSGPNQPPPNAMQALADHPPLGTKLETRLNEPLGLVLRDLPKRGGQLHAHMRESKGRCALQLAIDFDEETAAWSLKGKIEAAPATGRGQTNPQPRSLHEGITEADIDVDALLLRLGQSELAEFGQWDHNARRLAVSRHDLPAQAQAEFLHALPLRAVEVPGYGHFEGATLQAVPVGPTNENAATEWADELLVRALATHLEYRSVEAVDALFEQVVAGTPLAEFEPAPPAHADLREAPLLSQNPHVYWSFVAPADLAP